MFLDSSAIIEYQRGSDDVVEYLDAAQTWRTSVICVFEYVNGRLGTGSTDVIQARMDISDVQALDLNETIALESARMQDRLLDDGERLSTVDMLVAATARSTGDELVVADSDFETGVLEGLMKVTNLRN